MSCQGRSAGSETGSSSTPRRWPRSACLRQLALGGQQRLQIAEQRLAVAFGLLGRRPVEQGARKADERRCKLVASCRLGKALAVLGGRDRDLQVIGDHLVDRAFDRSEEHTSELQSLMRNSYAV